MNKKRNFTVDVMSKIDDDIIEKNKQRLKLLCQETTKKLDVFLKELEG